MMRCRSSREPNEIVMRPRPLPDSIRTSVPRWSPSDSSRSGKRLFEWLEVGTLQILDEGLLQRLAVVGLADDGRYAARPGELRRSEPALADEELVAALWPRSDHDRLQDPLLPDRCGELVELLSP